MSALNSLQTFNRSYHEGRKALVLISSTSACLPGFWYSLRFFLLTKFNAHCYYVFFLWELLNCMILSLYAPKLCHLSSHASEMDIFSAIIYRKSFYNSVSLLLSSLTWFTARLHNIFEESYIRGMFWADICLRLLKSRTPTCWALKSCFADLSPQSFLEAGSNSLPLSLMFYMPRWW